MRVGWTGWLGWALFALAATTGTALGHQGGSVGYASITIDGESARYRLTLWPATLPPAVAEQLRRARAGDGPSRDVLLDVIREKVALTADGRRCEAGPGSLLPATSATESVTLVVDFACGGEARDLVIRDDLFDVLGADYHTLGRIDAAGHTTQFAFTPESRETRARLTEPAGARGTASFLRLGIEHILSGWDHLLFLLGLLVRGGGWLALAKIITAFTLAHSVTLALAALDIVTLPDRLVEAVIALSIAFVAARTSSGVPSCPDGGSSASASGSSTASASRLSSARSVSPPAVSCSRSSDSMPESSSDRPSSSPSPCPPWRSCGTPAGSRA